MEKILKRGEILMQKWKAAKMEGKMRRKRDAKGDGKKERKCLEWITGLRLMSCPLNSKNQISFSFFFFREKKQEFRK